MLGFQGLRPSLCHWEAPEPGSPGELSTLSALPLTIWVLGKGLNLPLLQCPPHPYSLFFY